MQCLFGSAQVNKMMRADGTVEKRPMKRSMRSLLAALPTPSAARLLFVVIVSAILVVATGDSLGRIWPYVAVIGAAILAITVLYFASRFPTRTRPVATSIATLQSSTELFQVAFDFAAIGMALVFPSGRCQRVNRSLCEILGYTDRELLATDFQDFVHPDERIGARTKWEQLLSGRIPGYQLETRCIHREGHVVWVLWSVSKALVEQSESQLIFQIQNITDRKAAEERLQHDAFHDALTGLPNRALMMDHLRLAIARNKRRSNVTFAVLFLDLDRFKVVNDSFGHMIGDQLLVGIARRLEACVRPGDTVARVGGDEFTILLEDVTDVREAVSVAERIQQELKVPFNLSGRDVFTTVSVGIAPGSISYNQPDEVLRDADTAMYRSKSLGKARHETFDEEMQARSVNLLQMENDLRRAFERNEFFVNYQPIVALDDFRVCGFEALVRWQHPDRGLILPTEFIPIAEEGGQILQIGEWVLREACLQLQRWQARFPSDKPLYMTVNLSAKQFAQPDLVDRVRAILTETGIDPAFLKLEITESVVMDDFKSAAAMLSQLRALGVGLSIDDFGTGYSSLTYLHQFPIDTLKIDRSFVTRMDKENVEIVRTILMLAENLGMDAVAEGVETQEQMTLLRNLSCKCGQGYFFSKPMSVAEAEVMISETYYPRPALVA
jgi:diguanylate cyclase (GGDEF)-like protein/PAS domain S-box-containing protein